MRNWKWLASAALVGAGAVAVACSSSSSSPSDGGAAEGGGEDTGTTTDGGGPVEAAACEASTMNSATIDAGSAVWACLEAGCMTSLTACAADCECNNAILASLQCVQMMGGNDASMSIQMTCFTMNIGGLLSGPKMSIVSPLATCLTTMSAACGGPVPEGGGDAASDATGQ